MKLENGTNRILFSKGKIYLNGIQIGGEGVSPEKDILFEFKVNKPEEPIEVPNINKDPSLLEINVFDAIKGRDIGPGQ